MISVTHRMHKSWCTNWLWGQWRMGVDFILAMPAHLPILVGGGGGFSKVVATFSHVGRSFKLFTATTGDVWIIPSFQIWDCVTCWARFMCHHQLWPTSLSHPFSSLNSALGFAGGKHFQKITIPIYRLVPQNFAFPGCYPYRYILFHSCLFSSLSSG